MLQLPHSCSARWGGGQQQGGNTGTGACPTPSLRAAEREQSVEDALAKDGGCRHVGRKMRQEGKTPLSPGHGWCSKPDRRLQAPGQAL